MFTGISLGVVVAIIAVIALLGIIASGYVKAPPDTAFIISGLRKKIIIGKSSIKIPFLERLDKLSLKLIPIDVKTEAAVPTADYINIQVDAAVNVKVSSEPEKLKQAAENFLNQNTQYIAQVAREVLEGNMREIVGRMRLEEMVSDRQKFADLVKENAEPDLAAMGLDVVSFNVQNFTDSNGVIDDLGIDNISQIKKKAAIAKAEAEKEIAVAKAEADRQSNDARINSEREIAIKNNELDMQKAELQKNADSKRAEADAAYEIQKEEQRKTIEVTAANANIAKEERLVLLKQREAETMEKSLDAQVKKKAEAEKFERQQKAEAELFERQKEAEAKKFETEKAAEAQRAKAEADLFSKGSQRYPHGRRSRSRSDSRQRCCGGGSDGKTCAGLSEIQQRGNGGNAQQGAARYRRQDRRASDPDRQDHDYWRFGRIKWCGPGSRKRTGSDDKAV